MSQFTGIFNCGHEGRVNVTGKHDYRQQKADNFFNSHICEDCWKARIKEEKAVAFKEAENLPRLTGSEKQIAWAISIRQAKIEQSSAWVETQAEKDAWANVINSKTDAKFWIENREKSANEMICRITSQKKANEIFDLYTILLGYGISILPELERIGVAVETINETEVKVIVDGFTYIYNL